MSFFGRAPRGFKEPPRRSSDIHHGDLARLRERLENGDQVDIAVARKRKGKQSRNFVAYRRTGCFTKARVAAITPVELRSLAREFGYAGAWQVPTPLIIVSHAVWYRGREWR